MAQRGQKNKVFPAQDLDKNVFEVVLVRRRDGLGVAYPQVDGIRRFLESYTGKGYIFLGIGEKSQVFVAKVVILC